MANPIAIVLGGLIGAGGIATAVTTPILLSKSKDTGNNANKSETQETVADRGGGNSRVEPEQNERREIREKIDLKNNKSEFTKHCLLIAKSDDRAILVCQKFNSRAEASFYLYKKENGKETFAEFKQIETWDHASIQVTLLNSGLSGSSTEIVTFTKSQKSWTEKINRSPLIDKYEANWSDLEKGKLQVTCNLQRGQDPVILGEFDKLSTQLG